MTKKYTKGRLTTTENKKRVKTIPLRKVAEGRQTNHRENSKGINQALFVHLTNFAGHEVLLGEITKRFCTRFAKYLLKNVRISSAKTYLEKLNAILVECTRIDYLPHNPLPPISELIPKSEWRERPYLTTDEIQKLAEAKCPSQTTKLAFLFSCYTGLRLSDIETLTWSQIHRNRGHFTLVKRQKKTGREVKIPLVRQACQILARIERGRKQTVFEMRSRSSIVNDLKTWSKNAGIEKKITYHTSRHSFATMLVSGDVDIYTISKLCGHASISTTERYAHITEKRLHDCISTIEKQMISVDNRTKNENPFLCRK